MLPAQRRLRVPVVVARYLQLVGCNPIKVFDECEALGCPDENAANAADGCYDDEGLSEC